MEYLDSDTSSQKKMPLFFFIPYLGVWREYLDDFYCWVSDYFNVTEAELFQTADTRPGAWANHILGRMSQSVLMTSHEFLEIGGSLK